MWSSCTARPQGRRRWSCRGQSLVEFALAFPLLLLLVVGGSDLARAYFIGIEVSEAARASVMYIARSGPFNTPGSYSTALLPPTGSCTGTACSSYPAISIGDQSFAGSLITCPLSATTWTFSPAPDSFTPGTTGGYSSDSFEVTASVSCALNMLTPGAGPPVDIKAESSAYVVQP